MPNTPVSNNGVKIEDYFKKAEFEEDFIVVTPKPNISDDKLEKSAPSISLDSKNVDNVPSVQPVKAQSPISSIQQKDAKTIALVISALKASEEPIFSQNADTNTRSASPVKPEQVNAAQPQSPKPVDGVKLAEVTSVSVKVTDTQPAAVTPVQTPITPAHLVIDTEDKSTDLSGSEPIVTTEVVDDIPADILSAAEVTAAAIEAIADAKAAVAAITMNNSDVTFNPRLSFLKPAPVSPVYAQPPRSPHPVAQSKVVENDDNKNESCCDMFLRKLGFR